MSKDLNVGIVADWLVTYAGSEKVIKEFIELYPNASLYSVVDYLSESDRPLFNGKGQPQRLYRICLLLRKDIKNIYR